MAQVIEFPVPEASPEPGYAHDYQHLDQQLSRALLDCARCHIDTCEVPDEDEVVRSVAWVARLAYKHAETTEDIR